MLVKYEIDFVSLNRQPLCLFIDVFTLGKKWVDIYSAVYRAYLVYPQNIRKKTARYTQLNTVVKIDTSNLTFMFS
jgi:hypothetical protein